MISNVQRITQIKDILFEQGQVEVSDLSELFHVSGLTIRRDLEKLEKDGIAIRKYGGAQLSQTCAFIHRGTISKTEERLSEELIAKTAVKMIEPNDSVFVGGGEISVALIKQMQKIKPLYVVTNDLLIAMEMKNNPVSRTTVIGGNLDYTSGLLLGPQVIESLKGMYISKSIVELSYADINMGYMVNSYEEAEFIATLLSVSKTSVAMISSSGFMRNGMVRLGTLDMFDTVITDGDIPDVFKEYYFSNGVKLFTSIDIT